MEDPEGLNRGTRQVFDAHNRLSIRIDAAGGKTAYAYDARDNLRRVTDASGRQTAYTWDGFDNLIRRASPATGVTRYGYDAAGNRVWETDARGVTGRARYDALNRLTARRWPAEGGRLHPQDMTWHYDTGPDCGHGLGRLCELRDESGATRYRYDPRGLRLGQTVERDGRRHTTLYGYDGAGQRLHLTYPSGRRVDYARNRAGELLSISTTYEGQTQVLASRLAYRPFGPLSGMDYGNGLVRRQAYDPGGRLTRLLSGPGVQDLRYAYDQADNLIARHDWVSPAEGRGYAYDALNRLEEVSGAGLDLYTYDALGNRQSRVTAERLEHYRYDPESGRLRQREPGGVYDYDAGGRTTEDGRLRYRYGAQGRLAEITRAATGQRQAAYRYNALGERVKKLGTRVTYYHYDLEGRLLAETDAGGQTRAEYLYLGNEPLALGRSGQLYYYHNDHLGTPQKLTDGAGQVVWSASYRAFGEASIQVRYVPQNLRFPGQYYDEESGLHYNYFRYYDPSIGRYIQPDPTGILRDYSDPQLQIAIQMGLIAPEGLYGSLNHLYGYVDQNPINFIDPSGLDSLRAALIQAIGRGNTRQIRNIMDALSDPKLRKAAQDALDKFSSKAGDWIEKNCKGAINREFPENLRDKTLEEIRRGNSKEYKKAWKLLNKKQFQK